MKILKIKNCKECPFYRHWWVCGHAKTKGRDLAAPNEQIQDWCPLEDAEDKEWIKISDRLPEKPGPYLVFRKCNLYEILEWKYNYHRKYMWSWQQVTHWMPLPDAPE